MKYSLWMQLVLTGALTAGCRCTDDDEPLAVGAPKCPPSACAPGALSPSTERRAQHLPGALEEQIRVARASRASFQHPTKAEQSAYLEWVQGVAEAAWSDRLPSLSLPEGFGGRLAEAGRVWLLLEQPNHRRGAGIVALRPSATKRLIIEAPHSFFEPETLALAITAFEGLDARALLVNTAHRGGNGPRPERTSMALSGNSPSDVAHNPESHFAAAHRGLVALDPDVVTLQLHGFRDERAPGADVIVSAARTQADTQSMARALSGVLGNDRVRIYPDQIRVLGGTTNVQAQDSRRLRSAFYHLELSASLRGRLTSDKALTLRLVQALGAGVARSQ